MALTSYFDSPAFDNPLLKDHWILQMRPNYQPQLGFTENKFSNIKSTNNELEQKPISQLLQLANTVFRNHCFAKKKKSTYYLEKKKSYLGFSKINLCECHSESFFPELYGDKRTSFFIYWTRNYFRSTGCYNLLCPGFAQTRNEYTLILMSCSLILLGWFSI
ncbi:unnamed protein product [Coffea canephora]|uniref:DH200=94 genomic scaffold, scaffold_230 n=1 Tax=Coffea canephora TaxID=49390 RepID=A0A068VF75_COFCA|nr:unnamed protein product [Coffea canephora]